MCFRSGYDSIQNKSKLDIFLLRYFELFEKLLIDLNSQQVVTLNQRQFFNAIKKIIENAKDFKHYYQLIMLLREEKYQVNFYQLETLHRPILDTFHAMANYIISFISKSDEWNKRITEIKSDIYGYARAIDDDITFCFGAASELYNSIDMLQQEQERIGVVEGKRPSFLEINVLDVYNLYYEKIANLSYERFVQQIEDEVELRKAARLISQGTRCNSLFSLLPREINKTIALATITESEKSHYLDIELNSFSRPC